MYRSKWLISILIISFLGLSFVFFPQGTSSAPLQKQELVKEQVEEPAWESRFREQITEWIAEIGSKGSQFEDWLDAKYETYPLAPGSRQWVVIIYNNNQEIGYLIMEQISEEPLFSLIEYGRSDDAVFSKELQENPRFIIEDFVYSGLLWAKIEENCLVDLITTEKYEHVPLEQVDQYWQGQAVSDIQSAKVMPLTSGDPIVFLSDARAEPKTVSPANLQEAEHYFFQAHILPGVTGLYHILSVHTWSDLHHSAAKHLYIGLEDDGIRYFSSAYLEGIGTFEQIN